MATEKIWQYCLNNHLADYSSVAALSKSNVLALKNGLMGNGVSFLNQSGAAIGSPQGLWTMYASCDSVTAGTMNDGVDRIGADATKLVRNTAGNAHSWFVLKSPLMSTPTFQPGANFYLIGDVAAAGDQLMINYYWSKSAPTGGSTTARPTATDEMGFSNTGTYQNDNTATNTWWHLMLTTEGSFIYFAAKSGLGIPHYGAVFLLLSDTTAIEQYPIYAMNVYYAAGWGALGATWWFLWSNNATGNGNWGNRIYDGSALSTAGVAYPMRGSLNNSNWIDFLNSGFTTAQGDRATGKSPEFPMWAYTFTTNLYQYKGRIPDLMWGQSNLSPVVGCTDPLSGSPTSINMGGVWIPTNSALLWG
jgi:hypothetical protein